MRDDMSKARGIGFGIILGLIMWAAFCAVGVVLSAVPPDLAPCGNQSPVYGSDC